MVNINWFLSFRSNVVSSCWGSNIRIFRRTFIRRIFLWSFIAIGFLALILGLICGLVLLPTKYLQEEKSTNWFTYLRYYKVLFSCVAITNGFASAMYFENIMPLYLPSFGMTPILYGVYVRGFEIIYALTGMLWSYLAAKSKLIPFMFNTGLFATRILLFFLGPAKFLRLPPNSVGPVLGIYYIYGGTCSVFSTQYVSMNSYLTEVGLPTNLATKSMVSSITLFALAMGTITALPLSGYITTSQLHRLLWDIFNLELVLFFFFTIFFTAF